MTSEPSLTKEVKRIVRDLDVVRLVGEEVLTANEGAFGDGEGRAPGRKGKEKAREPDHRMWAVRTLCLKEGRDGTGGEDDYQVNRINWLSELKRSCLKSCKMTERNSVGRGSCGS